MLGIVFLLSTSNVYEYPSRSSEKEVVSPNEIFTMQRYQCWSDSIELSYSYRPSQPDKVIKVKVNGRNFKSRQIDKINLLIDNSNVDRISLFSCPMSKKDLHPIGFHIYLTDIKNVAAKRGITFFLTRDGKVQ